MDNFAWLTDYKLQLFGFLIDYISVCFLKTGSTNPMSTTTRTMLDPDADKADKNTVRLVFFSIFVPLLEIIRERNLGRVGSLVRIFLL